MRTAILDTSSGRFSPGQLSASSRAGKDALLLAGFLSSGIAAVGLELIWIRILGLAFGGESFGVLGVLAGFFAGQALGAAALHRVVLRSRRPLLIYLSAESMVAIYAVAGPSFLLRLPATLPRILGSFVSDNRSLSALLINLTVAMLVLLPATVSMGSTTTSVVEAWRRRRTRSANKSTVARLYALNTLGGALGVALTTYLLLPAVGVQISSGILSLFSLTAAALGWLWEHGQPQLPSSRQAVRTLSPMPARSPSFNYTLLLITGLAGIGLETVATHVLAQVFENTVHTFANVLVVYLLGTALGSSLYAKDSVRRFLGNEDRTTNLLLYGLTMAGAGAALVLAQSATILSYLATAESSYSTHLIADVTLTGLVFACPTILMGATFSHLVGHFTYEGAGFAYAMNTLGAALAPFVFGLVLIPLAGYGVAFYAAVALYLILFVSICLWRSRLGGWMAGGLILACAVAVLTYSPLVLVRFPSGSRVLAQHTGVQGVVSVTESAASRVLQVDQRFLMGGSPGFVTKRMGHLAMLLAPAPRRVLYLGVGTGITASAALAYPVERVTGVELIPEVLETLPWFDEFNNGLRYDPRVVLHASDARRFIRATPDHYDVIVADLYHPSRDGTGALYTAEHYAGIRGRLAPAGIFLQWLPLYQLRPHDLQTIVRTFLSVFPDAFAMIGNYSGSARLALVGAPGYAGIDLPRAAALLARQTGYDRVFDGLPDLLASYLTDSEGLRNYAGDGPLNTDINQRIVFDAASGIANEDGLSRDQTLVTLLPYRRAFPDRFIGNAGPGALSSLRQNLRPYFEALGHYLQAEIARSRPGDGSAVAFAEYLSAWRLDSRFTLAPGKLLELGRNQSAEKDVVRKIWEAHPDQPDFTRLYRRLQTVDAPDQVRAIVSRFLKTGGD